MRFSLSQWLLFFSSLPIAFGIHSWRIWMLNELRQGDGLQPYYAPFDAVIFFLYYLLPWRELRGDNIAARIYLKVYSPLISIWLWILILGITMGPRFPERDEQSNKTWFAELGKRRWILWWTIYVVTDAAALTLWAWSSWLSLPARILAFPLGVFFQPTSFLMASPLFLADSIAWALVIDSTFHWRTYWNQICNRSARRLER